MKERPVIFSPESVRAILAGTKTMTRRVIPMPKLGGPDWTATLDRKPDYLGCVGVTWRGYGLVTWDSCPYGQPGDRLWVREAWWLRGGFTTDMEGETSFIPNAKEPENVRFVADYAEHDWPKSEHLYDGWARKNAMFMPRRLSRLTLAITDIRVERLHAITTEDALAEGVGWDADSAYPETLPRAQYRELWDSLNAKRGYPWESNPWVWVVSFEVAA